MEKNIEEAEESLLLLKTSKGKLDKLISRIKELHSYEVPEIIAVQIEKAEKDYLQWLMRSVK